MEKHNHLLERAQEYNICGDEVKGWGNLMRIEVESAESRNVNYNRKFIKYWVICKKNKTVEKRSD